MKSKKPSNSGDVFNLPPPIVELVAKTETLMSSQLIVANWPIIIKFIEWNFVYFLSYIGYGYILFFLSIFYVANASHQNASLVTGLFSNVEKAESEVLKESLAAFPSWVAFPDFQRVEWINDILAQLWKNVDCFATFFVKNFIEPNIHNILDLMQLNQVSGFQVKRVDLGSIPARINGIKVYDQKHIGKDEIVMDCDVVYNGDARVIFTLQGISAQINSIQFRGTARIQLKPLLTKFPFIGGFEFYFLNVPTLDYSLGGIGSFGDVPGISSLVRSIVMDKIRSRFVWPYKFRLHFPLRDSETINKSTYMLPKPGGIVTLNLKEARDLLKKDRHLGGSGKSDPYAVISIRERTVNFRSQYVAKTVDPIWDYKTQFLVEDPNGQNLNIEVYDFDAGSSDDFLGKTSVALSSIVKKPMDKWITLNEVKHGDIHLLAEWRPAKSIEKENAVKTAIVSVFVDSCSNLAGGKSSSLYPKCVISLNGRQDDEFTTIPKNKTENPDFEQGWILTSNYPSDDQLVIEIIDVKGIDTKLGKVCVPITFLMGLPKQEFFDMNWPLEGGHPNAKMTLSAKLYTI